MNDVAQVPLDPARSIADQEEKETSTAQQVRSPVSGRGPQCAGHQAERTERIQQMAKKSKATEHRSGPGSTAFDAMSAVCCLSIPQKTPKVKPALDRLEVG